MPLRVQPIVEGQGEESSVRKLLERIWYDLFQADRIDVLRPLRKPSGTLSKEEGLKAAVNAAKIKLDNRPPDDFQKLVLILIDSEGKPPCTLAPQLLRWAKESRADADIACIMPHPMFETWFAASASSLAGVNGLPNNLVAPVNSEENKLGKAWLKKQLPRKYSETVDQPRFTAKMDLTQCRKESRSFDKLCRELEKRLVANPAAEANPRPASPDID